jgi:hypothetical protein
MNLDIMQTAAQRDKTSPSLNQLGIKLWLWANRTQMLPTTMTFPLSNR